jgi:hypothetical protein
MKSVDAVVVIFGGAERRRGAEIVAKTMPTVIITPAACNVSWLPRVRFDTAYDLSE